MLSKTLCGLPRWLSGKEPACQMQEMRVWSLGRGDTLEKEMAAHSSILAWEIPWTSYNPWGRKRVRHDLVTKQHHHHHHQKPSAMVKSLK